MTEFTCSQCGGHDLVVQKSYGQNMTYELQVHEVIVQTSYLDEDGRWSADDATSEVQSSEEIDGDMTDYAVDEESVKWSLFCGDCGGDVDWRFNVDDKFVLTDWDDEP